MQRRQLALLPFPLARQSFFQIRAWTPAEMTADLGRVGEGIALIAGPRRLLTDARLSAANFSQEPDDVPHRGRLAAADIVNLARISLDRGYGRRHAVGHIGIAPNLLPIAADQDWLLAEHGL